MALNTVFYYKLSSTARPVEATILFPSSMPIPIDLTTDATAIIAQLRLLGTEEFTDLGPAVAVGADTISYTWNDDDIEIEGTYEMVFEITFSGGSVERVPSKDYIIIEAQA